MVLVEPLLKLLADSLHSVLARGTAQRLTALQHVTSKQPITSSMGLKVWLGYLVAILITTTDI